MTKPTPPGPVIWCLGMYASASTWTFNAVRQIIEATALGTFHAAFVSGAESNVDWAAPGKVTVIKSHEIKGESRLLEVARRSTKILLTVRDPRDAVVSLMQAHEFDFARAAGQVAESAWLCRGFAKDVRARVMVYETGFFDDAATIAALAQYLGYPLKPPAAQSIHDSLNRSEVEKYITRLPKMPGVLQDRVSGDFLDPKTQWHSHHAGRTGKIGKWRNLLTAEQAEEIMSKTEYKASP